MENQMPLSHLATPGATISIYGLYNLSIFGIHLLTMLYPKSWYTQQYFYKEVSVCLPRMLHCLVNDQIYLTLGILLNTMTAWASCQMFMVIPCPWHCSDCILPNVQGHPMSLTLQWVQSTKCPWSSHVLDIVVIASSKISKIIPWSWHFSACIPKRCPKKPKMWNYISNSKLQ